MLSLKSFSWIIGGSGPGYMSRCKETMESVTMFDASFSVMDPRVQVPRETVVSSLGVT